MHLVKGNDWRTRPHLTQAETARLFGRSPTWAANMLTRRILTEIEGPNGRRFVSTDSVIRLLQREAETRASRAKLRLVIDNTPK